MFRIIDVHSHIGYYSAFNVSTTAENLVQEMKTFNISKSIVFAYDNDMVERALKLYNDLVGMVWVNPRDRHTVDFLKRNLKNPKFVGVKLHPLLDRYLPDDPIVHPIVEMTREAGWIVLIHCGHPPFSLPWSIEELVERFPDQNFILGHMGHGNIVYINGTLAVARRRKNVFLEPSGMPMHTKIKEAVNTIGRERVLWGSDTPFHDVGVELMKLQAADLSDEEMKAVLGANTERLFKIMSQDRSELS
ncbi:MAG: amidohydrolase family protein [Candidatus Caldarchaeum sp.]